MAPSDNEIYRELGEIYRELGELKAMAKQGLAEREKIFDKLDSIADRINVLANATSSIALVDAKTDKAHERLDNLVSHLDGVKTKALLIIGGAGAGGGTLGHFITPFLRKMGVL